ncbi:hypothetical protein SAMD00019534_102500 [Acytostelium subglobosum LB1]|uniref:hypothetical protein n=1 Tax=Acytostelium subglobosum LB1 TaxID=1410327 RepID=UPI0006450633|nr:hypothetical protein SAMD00019534_102500 [Acytostelium subglobosum LB1]GAM27075.1 hypothetical protein SAMD00019534_102500 [Acytostelium subglobosum LB1]|eukprot:XP_012749955.1 hypothetical protein SAMD00019534_102500 [Acytostelium subglobosum LB1]
MKKKQSPTKQKETSNKKKIPLKEWSTTEATTLTIAQLKNNLKGYKVEFNSRALKADLVDLLVASSKKKQGEDLSHEMDDASDGGGDSGIVDDNVDGEGDGDGLDDEPDVDLPKDVKEVKGVKDVKNVAKDAKDQVANSPKKKREEDDELDDDADDENDEHQAKKHKKDNGQQVQKAVNDQQDKVIMEKALEDALESYDIHKELMTLIKEEVKTQSTEGPLLIVNWNVDGLKEMSVVGQAKRGSPQDIQDTLAQFIKTNHGTDPKDTQTIFLFESSGRMTQCLTQLVDKFPWIKHTNQPNQFKNMPTIPLASLIVIHKLSDTKLDVADLSAFLLC